MHNPMEVVDASLPEIIMVPRSCYLVVLLGLFCGCQSQSDLDTGRATKTHISPPDTSLRLVGASMFREELAKHLGQVVLVDMWATW